MVNTPGTGTFPTIKGWRAVEAERGGLIVDALQDLAHRLGVAGEVAIETIEIDTGAREQIA